MEEHYGLIIAVTSIILIGVPFCTTAFFVIRRLHEMHTVHNKIEGELYVSAGGDMYSEFNIPIDDIIKRDYILLKVNVIKPKGGKDYGKLSEETEQA